MPSDIYLRFLEISQFRRLGHVQLDIDQKTTILVGANNSGKTSILSAIRHFLGDGAAFGAFDISLSMWPKLRALGKTWEALTEDPSAAGGPDDIWKTQLETLLSCMPSLDLWFHAEAGMYHYVSPFLSKLSWNGGLVGLRLRLEPASDIESLKQLAWMYATARAPVKDMGAEETHRFRASKHSISGLCSKIPANFLSRVLSPELVKKRVTNDLGGLIKARRGAQCKKRGLRSGRSFPRALALQSANLGSKSPKTRFSGARWHRLAAEEAGGINGPIMNGVKAAR